MKGLLKKIVNNFKFFISNNILFIIYIIFSLITEFIIRILTVGGHFYVRACIADLFILLFIGLFGYIFKPKNRFKYYAFWLFFNTGLCVANTIYYGYYKSFLSVDLIATASMLGEVSDSTKSIIHLKQFLYLLFLVVFIFINRYLKKKGYYEKIEINELKVNYKKLILTFMIIIGLLSISVLTNTSEFSKKWNRDYIFKKYGMYIYTINDLVQSINPKIDHLYGYDEAAVEFRNYYACKWDEVKAVNQYTKKFENKNILFVHMESIQDFVIDLKINGNEVTPNLNKLSREGIYFTKFYPQISIGTSSDTEFTLLTGLMPSSSGTVFVNYYDREYYSLPKYFNNMGYYTFSTHANDADYWNRKTMHKQLGYKDFYAKDSYEVKEEDEVGLGLGDISFFKQFSEKLRTIKSNNDKIFGTIITLSNHSPFNDLDVYGDFDLSIDYEYENEDGEKVKGTSNHLDGTLIGRYLQSAHYADKALGVLIDELREKDLLDNTILVFYGDHETRMNVSDYDLLYNYDYETSSIKDQTDEDYIEMDSYDYELNKNTPLIIWSNEEEYSINVDKVMGMYDVLPTIANMFGFTEKYALGHDIFDDDEGFVVFPNGNILTDKVYYSSLNEEYVSLNDEPISQNYITDIKEKAETILNVSNGIVTHDLIKLESDKIGVCVK